MQCKPTILILLVLWSCSQNTPPAPVAPPEQAPPAPVVTDAAETPETPSVPPPQSPDPAPAVPQKTPAASPPVQSPVPVQEVKPSVPEAVPEPVTVPEPEPEPEAVRIPTVPLFLQFGFQELGAKSAVDAGGKKIVLIVPFGTSLTALTPVFSTNNSRVSMAGEEILSRTRALSWTRPQKFLLVSEDGVEAEWSVEVTVTPASKDSKLGSVTVGNFPLMPPFDPAVASYSIFIPQETTALTLSAEPSYPKAKMTIQVNDGLSPVPLNTGKPLNLTLTPGENNLFLKVTAEDGRTNTYYVFVVKRR